MSGMAGESLRAGQDTQRVVVSITIIIVIPGIYLKRQRNTKEDLG
jgi:hypothetical protein